MITVELATPLDEAASARLLEFCLDSGVDCFTVTALYSTKADRKRMQQTIFDPLAPFMAGRRRLERTVVHEGRDRFVECPCWRFDREAVPLILRLCEGSLTSQAVRRLPEDWAFYRGEALVAGVVTHENYAFIRLRDDELAGFEATGIAHRLKPSG